MTICEYLIYNSINQYPAIAVVVKDIKFKFLFEKFKLSFVFTKKQID